MFDYTKIRQYSFWEMLFGFLFAFKATGYDKKIMHVERDGWYN